MEASNFNYLYPKMSHFRPFSSWKLSSLHAFPSLLHIFHVSIFPHHHRQTPHGATLSDGQNQFSRPTLSLSLLVASRVTWDRLLISPSLSFSPERQTAAATRRPDDDDGGKGGQQRTAGLYTHRLSL